MKNLEVCTRTVPLEGRTEDPGMLMHVRDQYGARTLCGLVVHELWDVLADEHPEDVEAYDRCASCYKVIEWRKRQERAGGGYTSSSVYRQDPISFEPVV